MSGTNPQPVLRLVAGSSRQMVRVFTPGVAVPPFSIGTHADWVVEAAGVEPIHFFASFDGAQLHVAIGSPTARLSLRLNAVGREWVLAQPPSALIFGEACLALSQEVIPSAAPAPSPSLHTQFIDPVPAPVAPITAALPPVASGAEPPHPFAGTAKLASPSANPTGFAPVPAQPRVRSQPVQVQAPQPVPTQPAQGWQPHAPAQPQHGLGATAMIGSNAAIGGSARIPDTTLPSNSPGYAAHPVQPPAPAMAAPIAAQPLWTQPEPPMPVARPLAGSGEPLAIPFDDSGPTTLVDRGALRDHAARIAAATPSLAAASTEAYAAKVRALSTAPGTGEAIAPTTAAAPQWKPSAPPPAAAAPGPALEKIAKPPSRLVAEWRRASWLMRAMLVLLPVGVYVTLWTPGQDDPISTLVRGPRAPEAKASKAKQPAATPSQQAAHPAASGAILAASGSATAPTASAASADSAAPAASVAAPSSSASTQPSIVLLEPGARPSKAAPASKAVAASSVGARGEVPSERAAIDAAFQGRTAEAASLYDGLSKGPNAAVFALAARLVRADSVRKPAISH